MARRKAGNRERGAQPGLGEDAGPWPRAWGCDGRWRGGGCGGRLFAARLLLRVEWAQFLSHAIRPPLATHQAQIKQQMAEEDKKRKRVAASEAEQQA